MSLEFCDGFDHYNDVSQLLRKWTAAGFPACNFVSGRFGGLALKSNASGTKVRLDLTAVATRVMGFAVILPTSADVICEFKDSGSAQVEVRYTGGSQQLQVTRNGTVLGTASGTYASGGSTWHYIEFKALIDPSVGTIDLKVGGVSVLSLTAQNTRNTANSSTNQIIIGNSEIYYDDVYILNTSGSVNNNFLGECRILTTLASADGASSAWTPNSGTAHFSRVNEASPDDDSSYVSSATVGQIDTYQYPDISPTGPVAAVQVTLADRKDDAAARTICAEYRSSGGTNYDGATSFSPATSYGMHRQIWETDPATSAAWTAAGINGGEFGVKVVS